MAGVDYTVKQGDHLSTIAAQHGFPDHTVIWNHPDNARRKQERMMPALFQEHAHKNSQFKKA